MSLSVSAVSSVSGAMLAISGDDPLSAGSFRKKRAALLTAKLPVEPAEGSETARFQAVGTIVLKVRTVVPASGVVPRQACAMQFRITQKTCRPRGREPISAVRGVENEPICTDVPESGC